MFKPYAYKSAIRFISMTLIILKKIHHFVWCICYEMCLSFLTFITIVVNIADVLITIYKLPKLMCGIVELIMCNLYTYVNLYNGYWPII